MESKKVKENQRLMQVVFELQLVWPGAHPQTVGWPGLNAVLIILRHMASYNEGYTLAPAQWEKNPILKLAFQKVTESPSDSELALRAKLADMFKKEHGRLATFSELFESDLIIQTLFTWPRLLNIFETKTWEIYPGGPSHWTEGQEYSLLECAQNSIVQWNGQMALEDWFQHRFKPFSDPSEPSCKVLYLYARPRFLYIKYTHKDGQPEHRFASLQTLSLDLLYAFPDSDPQMSKLDYKVTHYKLIATVRLADDAFPTDHIRTYGLDGTYIQGIGPPKHVQEGHENIVNNHWHVGDTEGTYILIYVFEADPKPLDSQEDLELDQADLVDPSLLTPLGGIDQDYNFSLPPIPPQSDVPPETSPVIGKTPLPNVGESKEDKSSLPSSVAKSTKTSAVATPDIASGALKLKRHGPLLTGQNSEAKATVSKNQPVQSQTPARPPARGGSSLSATSSRHTSGQKPGSRISSQRPHENKTEKKTEELQPSAQRPPEKKTEDFRHPSRRFPDRIPENSTFTERPTRQDTFSRSSSHRSFEQDEDQSMDVDSATQDLVAIADRLFGADENPPRQQQQQQQPRYPTNTQFTSGHDRRLDYGYHQGHGYQQNRSNDQRGRGRGGRGYRNRGGGHSHRRDYDHYEPNNNYSYRR